MVKTCFVSILMFMMSTQTAWAVIPSDPYVSEQWYLNAIDAPSAWESTTGSSDVIVAVLDTGFDLDHPDLVGNIWINSGEVAGDGIDNDGNGYIDDVHGYDFVDDDATPIPSQGESVDKGAAAHATMIAGIIGAAAQNNEGIAGINWNVRLMNVRILDNQGTGGSGAASDAIHYAVENGADVINLSFTGFEIDTVFKTALKRAFQAGVVIVAAVGNTEGGGINVDDKPIYPACHGENEDEDWVIGVAASDVNDIKSDFSNYGSLCTDLSAPGEDIFSTTYQDDTWRAFTDDYYESGWAGTSLAVPMVAGAAALLKSLYSQIEPSEVETLLRLSADPLTTSAEAIGKVGAGRLNIARAIELAPVFVASAQAVEFMIPETAPDALVKLACQDGTDEQDPCRAVYFYGTDGKRHAFPNEKVYFSWYNDFDEVVIISAASMSSLPLGKNVTYHPGTKLVKFQSMPIVYAVAKKNVLREILNESVAAGLYGSKWNTQVDDIPDVFFSNYTFGQLIQTSSDYSILAQQSSVTSPNDLF